METQAHANWQPERLACLVSFVSVVQRPLEGHLFGLRTNAASACSPSRRTHTHSHRHLQAVGECVCESGQLKCFKVLHGQHINKCLHIYFVLPPLDFPCIPHPPSIRLLPLASLRFVALPVPSTFITQLCPCPGPCPCRGVLLSALFTCNLKLLPCSTVLQSRAEHLDTNPAQLKRHLLRQ